MVKCADLRSAQQEIHIQWGRLLRGREELFDLIVESAIERPSDVFASCNTL